MVDDGDKITRYNIRYEKISFIVYTNVRGKVVLLFNSTYVILILHNQMASVLRGIVITVILFQI